MKDIVWNKKEGIERCIKQIRSYYFMPGNLSFDEDFLKQDAIAMNLQRACELSIDLANYVIKIRKLGLPKDSRESFRLLAEHGIIPKEYAIRLGKMIGFRNILVHEYQKFDTSLMVNVIENHLDDLLDFTNYILKEFSSDI